MAHDVVSWSYVQKGMYVEAAREAQEGARLFDSRFARLELAFIYAKTERRGEALKTLERVGKQSKPGGSEPWKMANLHIALGEKQKALDWLESGFEERDPDMVFLKVWPRWDPLRSDPRYQDLLRRMNFPE